MTEIDQKRKRSRSGGGSARRAERTAVKIESARFITRNIPNFEVLTTEAIEIIEYNAETVLEEVGVAFTDNSPALKIWKDAGAEIEGERVNEFGDKFSEPTFFFALIDRDWCVIFFS